jgi:hypothetical protein
MLAVTLKENNKTSYDYSSRVTGQIKKERKVHTPGQ